MASTRWGIMGAARIAREQVVPAIRRTGAGEVLAVSSASGKAAAWAQQEAVPRAYHSHAQLLADPDVESVYIALPNSLHAEWIIRAAQAGKHVLCEKPIVMQPEELQAVDRAARESGVVVAEAFMYRHHRQMQEVASLVRDGTLGDLVALQARLHFCLDRHTGADDIRLNPHLGGGSLWDLGCYPVDLFGFLLGAAPDEVSAVAVREHAEGVDTRFAATLRYGTAVATMDCSFDAPFQGTATIIGTRGSVRLGEVFRADRVGGTAPMVLEVGDQRHDRTIEGDQYGAEVLAFAHWVRQGRGDRQDWDLTHRTTQTLAELARAAGLAPAGLAP